MIGVVQKTKIVGAYMVYEIVVGRSESDRQKYGLDGTILIGKHYVRMGDVESLSNRVLLDVNHSQVIFICGKRGSGKSYTLGAIAEGIAVLPPKERSRISAIILDTMGIFWTMKYPNLHDKQLLREWGLSGDGLDVVIFTPAGYFTAYREKGIPTDYAFSLLASELSAGDWCMAFDVSPTSAVGVLIERVVNELTERGGAFGLEELIAATVKSGDAQAQAVVNRFENAKTWGLFNERGTPLLDLIRPGQIAILDVSCYAGGSGSWNIRALVIGIIAQKMFLHRMGSRKDEEYHQLQKEVLYTQPDASEEEPLIWLLIDEAHEFLPREGKVASSDALITVLREGRQPGLSLVLATQQPGKIHTDVMTQSNIVIAHRITAKLDTDALGTLTQSYMRGDLDTFLNQLPRVKGAAIVLDDANEKIIPIRVRPRQTWHGGSDPEMLKKE
jgi:hypothetical protein